MTINIKWKKIKNKKKIRILVRPAMPSLNKLSLLSFKCLSIVTKVIFSRKQSNYLGYYLFMAIHFSTTFEN